MILNRLQRIFSYFLFLHDLCHQIALIVSSFFCFFLLWYYYLGHCVTTSCCPTINQQKTYEIKLTLTESSTANNGVCLASGFFSSSQSRSYSGDSSLRWLCPRVPAGRALPPEISDSNLAGRQVRLASSPKPPVLRAILPPYSTIPLRYPLDQSRAQNKSSPTNCAAAMLRNALVQYYICMYMHIYAATRQNPSSVQQ